MNEFKDLKENNLIKNNLKQDNQNSYLKNPNYNGLANCHKCNDLNWLINEENVPVKCDCSKNIHTDLEKRLIAAAGSVFTEKFNNYIQDTPIKKRIFKLSKSWCENIGKPGKPTHLFLFGNTGTGKSHIAKSSLNFLVTNNKSVRYILYTEFHNEIKDFDENVSLKIKDLFEYPILIFDEMYMGYDKSKYVYENFNSILLTRWERKLPTMVTGNIKPNQLTSPIVSRFFDDSMTIRIDTWKEKDNRFQKAF